MNQRQRLTVVLSFLVLAAIGCVHTSGKPYSALDYAKKGLLTATDTFEWAVAAVPSMKESKNAAIRSAYPETLAALVTAGDALAAYGRAVRIWEISHSMPEDIGDLRTVALELVNNVVQTLINLGVLPKEAVE